MTTGGPEWSGPPPGPPGGVQPTPPPPYYYPGAPAPATEGMAIAALILSICSFVVFPLIPAIVALVLASSSRKKIAESGGRLTGESLNKAAVIVSWINIGICAAVVFLIIIIVIAATASTSA